MQVGAPAARRAHFGADHGQARRRRHGDTDTPAQRRVNIGRRRRIGSLSFLFCSLATAILPRMTDPSERLTPASAEDLGDALAFALRFQGRKRVHNAGEIMAEIVAKGLVEHLERSGFVVMKKPSIKGGAALGRGFKGP